MAAKQIDILLEQAFDSAARLQRNRAEAGIGAGNNADRRGSELPGIRGGSSGNRDAALRCRGSGVTSNAHAWGGGIRRNRSDGHVHATRGWSDGADGRISVRNLIYRPIDGRVRISRHGGRELELLSGTNGGVPRSNGNADAGVEADIGNGKD